MSASAITDALRIQGHMQFSHVLAAATPSQSNQLFGGLYDIWADAGDMFIKVGPSVNPIPAGADQPAVAAATDVTAANGYMVRAGNTITVFVPYGARIGMFSTAGTTAHIHKVGE